MMTLMANYIKNNDRTQNNKNQTKQNQTKTKQSKTPITMTLKGTIFDFYSRPGNTRTLIWKQIKLRKVFVTCIDTRAVQPCVAEKDS